MADLGVNLWLLIAYLVNFIILLGILLLFAYKPLLRVLDQRAERIRESLAAADRAREEAATSQAAIQEQLNEARREGQRLLDQAREASDRYREEEMARAPSGGGGFRRPGPLRHPTAAGRRHRGGAEQFRRPGHHCRRAGHPPLLGPAGASGVD